MLTIHQNRTNKVVLDITTSVSNPYFLIRFTNCEVGANTISLFERVGGGSWYIIHIVEVGENGIEDKVNGELRLGPAGDWKAEIWAQTSSTNLNPNLSEEFIEEINLIVLGNSCDSYQSDNDSCPTITLINGGSLELGNEQYNEINGLLDGCTLE